MRLVGPDEREPEGEASLTVIVEDLTAVRDQVIELEVEAENIPDVRGENMRATLAGLRVHVEVVIGQAQAERGITS